MERPIMGACMNGDQMVTLSFDDFWDVIVQAATGTARISHADDFKAKLKKLLSARAQPLLAEPL
jgi:hypothetical protein